MARAAPISCRMRRASSARSRLCAPRRAEYHAWAARGGEPTDQGYATVAVLVTGVGYIGAALAARLLRAGERVVALDNGFATDLAAVAQLADLGDFELVRGSVTIARDVARAFARGPFDVAYHLAARAS